MFRQTVVRAIQKRGLEGGATNDSQDKNLVRMTLRGDFEQIEDLIAALRQARHGMALEAHQVTTTTVENRRWNPNITMFI
ncbi:unnamed protein product [Peronospora destructor]|nr:unnamed protein product [Peronospora destructor]